jgi:anti-sigma regulatory factor (Ser/Thr protein kinase)
MSDVITLPGRANMVALARRGVCNILGEECPRLADVELAVSELVTNAVLHSRSRDVSGSFSVLVETKPGWARVEILDDGAAPSLASIPADEADEYGRGLKIVEAVSDRWGQDVHQRSTAWWVEFDWTES